MRVHRRVLLENLQGHLIPHNLEIYQPREVRLRGLDNQVPEFQAIRRLLATGIQHIHKDHLIRQNRILESPATLERLARVLRHVQVENPPGHLIPHKMAIYQAREVRLHDLDNQVPEFQPIRRLRARVIQHLHKNLIHHSLILEFLLTPKHPMRVRRRVLLENLHHNLALCQVLEVHLHIQVSQVLVFRATLQPVALVIRRIRTNLLTPQNLDLEYPATPLRLMEAFRRNLLENHQVHLIPHKLELHQVWGLRLHGLDNQFPKLRSTLW